MKNQLIRLLLALIAISATPIALANNCTSTGGNWATTGTWASCGGTTPQPADTVTITAGTVTLNTTATIAGLSVNGGTLTFGNNATLRTLTVNGNIVVATGATINVSNFTVTHRLNVSGNVTNNGTFDLVLDANSLCNLAFTGGASHTLGGNSAGTTELNNVTVANNLSISKTGAAITQTGTLNVTANLDVTAGTYNLANAATVTGTTSITGTLAHTTATGTRTFTGAVTINAGGAMTETGAVAVSFGNNFTNNNTFTSGTGTHTFTGASPQILGTAAISFGGGVTANNSLTVNKATGVVTVAGSLLINAPGAGGLTVTAGTLNLANTLTVAGPTSITGTLAHTTATGTRTFTGAVTINGGGSMTETLVGAAGAPLVFGNNLTINASGTLSEAGTATVSIAGDFTNNGTYTSSTGLHTFTAAAVHNLLGANPILFNSAVTSANGITVNKAGTTVTVNGAFNVTGNLTVTAGTLNLANSTATAGAVSGTTSITGTLAHTTATGTRTFTGAVTINGGGSMTETLVGAAGAPLVFGNNLTINASGTLSEAGTATVSIAGNFTNNGTYTPSTGVHTFNGTLGQTITGATAFSRLTIADAAGVTISNNVTVSTLLTLTSGAVTTGANTLAVTANCPGSIARTSGYVVGNLKLTFPANAATTCTYMIGSGAVYAPVVLRPTVSNVGPATLTASTAGAEHPNIGTSIINAARDANRYWSLWAAGDTSTTITAYTATLNFVAGDVDVGATPTLFIAGWFNTVWNYPSTVTPLATSTAVTVAAGITSATLFAAGETNPQNCTSQASTNWNLASTWINCRGGIPLIRDNVIIASPTTVPLNVNSPLLGNLTINSGGRLNNTGANTLSLGGAFANSGTYGGTGSGAISYAGSFSNTGTYTGGTGAVTLSGNFTNSGTFTSGNNTWTLNGTTQQTLTGTTTFTRLRLNNTSATQPALQLGASSNVTLTTSLTLTNGVLNAGSNSVLLPNANCPGSIARTNGFVDGNLQLRFPANATTVCTYPVGSGTTYSPVGLNAVVSNAGTATLTAKATGIDLLATNTTSNIDPAKDVNRYWTLWATGDSSATITSYGATFNFVAGDVDVGAVTGNFIAGKFASSAWTYPTPTPGATSMGVSGIAGISAASQFVAGEPKLSGFLVQSTAGLPLAGQTQNIAFNIMLTAVDPSGNTIPTFTGTVDITSSCTLVAGSGTTASFTAGVLASHTVSISSTGNCTITATRTSGTEAGTSATFTVSAPVSAFDGCEYNAASRCDPLVTGFDKLFTKLANTAITLDFVGLKSDNSLASGYSGTVTVALLANTAVQSVNPVTHCPATATATIPLGNLAVSNGRASSAITVAANAFSSVAPNYSAYRDVRMQFVCDAANCPPSGFTSCSVDNFAVRPQSFNITSVDAYNSGSSGSPAVKAGAGFNLTATAVAGYNGTPSIDTSQVIGSPNAGVLAGTLGSATIASGASSGSFTYAEVGNFGLSADSVTDQTYTGADLPGTDCIANTSNTQAGGKYGCYVGSPLKPVASGFGRFIPDHFAVTTQTLTPACTSGLTYMGQPFTFAATVEARNLADGLTSNYQNGYATASVSVVAEDQTAANQGTDLGSRISGLGSASWAGGRYAIATTAAVFSRPVTPVATPLSPDGGGPFDLLGVGVKLSDPDGSTVTSPALNMNASTTGTCGSPVACDAVQVGTAMKMRFGRLRLDGAYGSNLLQLQLPLRAEYISAMSGSTPSFALNTADSCTVVPATAVALGNPVGGIASTVLSGSTLNAGVGKITLQKPTTGTVGSLDVAVNLGNGVLSPNSCVSALPSQAGGAAPTTTLGHLLGKWCGSNHDRAPSARVKFGTSKSPVIYFRERY